MADLEQHFVRPECLDGLVTQRWFAGRDIVEFGAGQGGLTRLLLDGGARSVEAWEIDPTLGSPSADPRLSWRTRDILSAVAADVAGRSVAAFPPYATLPFLLDLCVDVPDLMLMVPPKRLGACGAAGLRTVAELGGDAFDPPSTGAHLIVARGWGA